MSAPAATVFESDSGTRPSVGGGFRQVDRFDLPTCAHPAGQGGMCRGGSIPRRPGSALARAAADLPRTGSAEPPPSPGRNSSRSGAELARISSRCPWRGARLQVRALALFTVRLLRSSFATLCSRLVLRRPARSGALGLLSCSRRAAEPPWLARRRSVLELGWLALDTSCRLLCRWLLKFPRCQSPALP